MSKIFVLDACALVALLKKEKGADIVASIYQKAVNKSVNLYVNRLNLLELYYGFYRDKGEAFALHLVKSVERSPIFISEFDREIFLEAGRLKATYKISLADSVVLAQAIILNGSVITADHHEFDAIEGKENIRFTRIR
jgi:PIN domain nuclease of toxin-antitoxin system